MWDVNSEKSEFRSSDVQTERVILRFSRRIQSLFEPNASLKKGVRGCEKTEKFQDTGFLILDTG
jgi:hypothetical protein